ncbi:hypothetical protein BD779DRAFT_1574731 [Infundibulicybe gibba]|nr:hypothetical protein BD779DRAFT_1574731 [Infundibulicybe gibba]
MTRCTTPLSINPALLSLFVTLDADSDPSLMVARGRIQGFQIVSGSMVSVGVGNAIKPPSGTTLYSLSQHIPRTLSVMNFGLSWVDVQVARGTWKYGNCRMAL